LKKACVTDWQLVVATLALCYSERSFPIASSRKSASTPHETEEFGTLLIVKALQSIPKEFACFVILLLIIIATVKYISNSH
jgi:hypothetical protein